jgi:hypothetical protein
VHSDEVYEEPDFTAVDELYSSPRGRDADRSSLSPFGGSYQGRGSGSFEGTAAAAAAAVGRRGSGSSSSPGRQPGVAAAPAAEAAALGAAAAVAPPATPSTGFAGSRLWSVLAGGSSPAPVAPPQQQQQQSQQQQQWGYSGSEDLPPSLAGGGSNGSGAASTAPMGTAGGSRGWGQGENVVHEGEGSSGEEEVYVDGADIDAVGAGVPATAAGGAGDAEVYQEASEEIEPAGGSVRGWVWVLGSVPSFQLAGHCRCCRPCTVHGFSGLPCASVTDK